VAPRFNQSAAEQAKIRKMDFSHMAPVFMLGISIAVFGWSLVRISARIERQRAEHHVSKYGPPN
jgi:hypothetical protein